MTIPEFSFVADFSYSSEAQIFKGLLKSNGIEVFMRDNFTIDSDPLLSNAIGGVKLFVRTENLEKAREYLSETQKFSVDNSGNPIVCPNCNQPKVELVTSIKEGKSLFAFVVSMLFMMLPFYAKYTYKCANCGQEFEMRN